MLGTKDLQSSMQGRNKPIVDSMNFFLGHYRNTSVVAEECTRISLEHDGVAPVYCQKYLLATRNPLPGSRREGSQLQKTEMQSSQQLCLSSLREDSNFNLSSVHTSTSTEACMLKLSKIF